MKIISLIAENVKGLKAVEIVPDDTLQIISGKNGQGKSSVMDSIWLAIGGGEASKGSNTTRAIRDGQESASVTLDLGDIIVTRKWTSNDKSTLKVESKDGTQFKSPQTMLNNLIGKLSFDPLAFSNLDNKKQIETLMSMVELPKDPAIIDLEKKSIFEERTILNREIKSLKLQLENKPDFDEDLPEEEILSSDILKEMQTAQKVHNQFQDKKREYAEKELEITKELTIHEDTEDEIKMLRLKIQQLSSEQDTRLEKISTLKNEKHKLEQEVNEFIAPDLQAINERASQVETLNKKIREKNHFDALDNQLTAKSQVSENFTLKIKELEEEKQQMIQEANFPIDGLSFDEDGVLYNGVPLKQCSSAERLKVSMAIAMSLNPKLKVIRIMDGSLLDSNNLSLIKDMAGEKDYQIWVEQVDESGTVGIVIENGEVKSLNQPKEIKDNKEPVTKISKDISEQESLNEKMMNLSF